MHAPLPKNHSLYRDRRWTMVTVSQRRVAGDFMQRDVVTVAPNSTLREALSLMTENHVTGLPVMDSLERCIGLITSSDILNYEQDNDGDPDEGRTEIYDAESQQWETVLLSAFGLEKFGDVQVREVMTRDLIWVDRDTPLKDVARRMIDERVHRVLVMDVASRLYGILSAYDFVRLAAES
jgi:CBS domain-containing protein